MLFTGKYSSIRNPKAFILKVNSKIKKLKFFTLICIAYLNTKKSLT